MKALVLAALLAATASTAAASSTQFGNDGENLCVEYDLGHMWMNAAWEKRGEFQEGGRTYTAWVEYGSPRAMVTYEEYVKTFEGRIILMLCQLAETE